jgi:hypothetical protein
MKCSKESVDKLKEDETFNITFGEDGYILYSGDGRINEELERFDFKIPIPTINYRLSAPFTTSKYVNDKIGIVPFCMGEEKTKGWKIEVLEGEIYPSVEGDIISITDNEFYNAKDVAINTTTIIINYKCVTDVKVEVGDFLDRGETIGFACSDDTIKHAHFAEFEVYDKMHDAFMCPSPYIEPTFTEFIEVEINKTKHDKLCYCDKIPAK